VHLAPIKKSLSINRKSGKVKEEFTLKGVYSILNGITSAQKQLLSTTAALNASQNKAKVSTANQDKKIADLASMVKDTAGSVGMVSASMTIMRDDIMASIVGVTNSIAAISARRSSVQDTPGGVHERDESGSVTSRVSRS
jgi:hypothetical protein